MPHLGDGPVPVVGHDLNQHSDAARGIALVGQLLHIVRFTSAGASGNGVVDGVALHVGTEGFIDRRAKTRVVFYEGPTRSRSHNKFTNQFCKQLTALRVLSRLAVLDICPFTVASHGKLLVGGGLGASGAQ